MLHSYVLINIDVLCGKTRDELTAETGKVFSITMQITFLPYFWLLFKLLLAVVLIYRLPFY